MIHIHKELTLDAAVENLSQVLAFLEENLEQAECPMKAQMQIGVAAEEIYVNIAHYAYDKAGGNVTVNVEVTPETAVITFIDSGAPYDPLKKPGPDVTLPMEKRAIGGLGVFMAKKLMDELIYEYRNGQNILTMKKNI